MPIIAVIPRFLCRQLILKTVLAGSFLVALLFSSANATPPSVGDWELIWSDEFDYNGQLDTAKWDYEEGLVRNAELQYYTRQRLENVRVENGMLVIEGRKEPLKNPEYKADSNNWRQKQEYAQYTSGSITTKNKTSWLYGRIEVRAKLPQGRGVWPAIWTLSSTKTTAGTERGEIDIMEFIGKDPNTIYGTVHYYPDGKHASCGGTIKIEAPFDNFHIYAIEWYPDRIDFFFDKTKYFSFPTDKAGTGPDNPFRKPHYLIINLALGGSWGGEMDDSVLPQKYIIDYVRIYQTPNQQSPGRQTTVETTVPKTAA